MVESLTASTTLRYELPLISEQRVKRFSYYK
jgi:hypothetical protein